jgi:hypothetical protein
MASLKSQGLMASLLISVKHLNKNIEGTQVRW